MPSPRSQWRKFELEKGEISANLGALRVFIFYGDCLSTNHKSAESKLNLIQSFLNSALKNDLLSVIFERGSTNTLNMPDFFIQTFLNSPLQNDSLGVIFERRWTNTLNMPDFLFDRF